MCIDVVLGQLTLQIMKPKIFYQIRKKAYVKKPTVWLKFLKLCVWYAKSMPGFHITHYTNIKTGKVIKNRPVNRIHFLF